MKRTILTGILALAAGVPVLMAQARPAGQPAPAAQAAPAGQAAPAAPSGPHVKSPEEMTALRALVAAQNQGNADAIVKAAEDFVTQFADTEFKEMALSLEAAAYQMKNDAANAQVAWGRVVAVNPKSLQGNLKMGGIIAAQTRDKDLDRDDNLALAEKYLKTAMEILKTAPKPNPQITDPDWEVAKKQMDAEAHNGLGLVALTRASANKDPDPKKYTAAVDEFQIAASEDPDLLTYSARLAAAYQNAGRSADAIAICDKLLANPQLNPAIKDFITNNVRPAATKALAAPAK